MAPRTNRVTPVMRTVMEKYSKVLAARPKRCEITTAPEKPRRGIEPKSVKAINIAAPFSIGPGALDALASLTSISCSAFAERYSPAAIDSASASTVEIPMTSVSDVLKCREPATAASKANVVRIPSIPPNTTPRMCCEIRNFCGSAYASNPRSEQSSCAADVMLSLIDPPRSRRIGGIATIDKFLVCAGNLATATTAERE
mmetsp:Transcript_56771/g.93944  ORF Transcript_56771/g.93944 Transcript_56771/m.93944 type:complete len:200 (-) Transcript_56771:67-666(-)